MAKKHDVPPTLFVAIVSSESQWGKGANATKQKNPLSVMGAGTIHDSAYPTIDKGLEAGAKNLNELYISEGLTTPEKIGPKYAPTEGATNDPDGMNNAWIPTVKSIMKDLGGEKAKTSCSDSKGSDGKGFDFKGKFPKPDKSKYNGQSYPWGQCTWYVHQRRKEIGKPVPLTWGNGGDWGDNAKAQGWNVGSKPKAGAGASIKPGNFGAPPPYGHIMFVEKVKDDGGIIVSEANVKGEGVISSREFSKADTQKMQFIYDK
ncbi:TPA: CHAP domain-containing protein [Staphylococcus aureus]|nr:CHAP domain-containing protein [Staphylococcus aureus]